MARAGRHIAELHAPMKTEADRAHKAAAELRARQVARIGAGRLDPAIGARFPDRSHVPFLARQWDETAADLAVYLARWNITSGGAGSWEWALGPKSDDVGVERERRQVAARLIDLTVASAREQLARQGVALPDWARAHLAHHAARGICAQDPRQLTSVYQRIDAFRREAGVEDSEGAKSIEEALLGPPPNEAGLRMKRRVLLEETLRREPPGRQPVARAGA